MKAIWRDTVIAESNETVVVENNHYFPPNSIKEEHFEKNPNTSVCPWKGTANYYDVVVNGERNADAAWYYATPSKEAENIKGYLGFWRGVKITD